MNRITFIVAFISVFCFSCLKAQIKKEIDPKTGFLKITNGTCGIVIPWKDAATKKVYDWAPIQSFIYKDGTWSDTSVNKLQVAVKPYFFTTTIKGESTNELIIKLEYKFNKPKFDFYGQIYKGGEAGTGFYFFTVTIRNNKKSITIEEETNYDILYQISIQNGLNADQARYRGYQATSLEHGREPDGKIYRAEHDRGFGLDAIRDLDFSKETSYGWWPAWEVAGGEQNTGRYWQFYNNNETNSSNIFGFFQGKPSRLKGASSVGPTIWSATVNGGHQLELRNSIHRRGPDNSWFPHKRFQWNAFISTKVDLLSPERNQPIAEEMNLLAGLGGRIKSYSQPDDKIIPAFFDGAIYQDKISIQNVIKKVKSDQNFYNYLVSIDDGLGYPIYDVWRNPDQAKKYIKELVEFKKYLLNEYTKGDGSFSLNLRYWKGVRTFKGKALLIAALFADKSIKVSPIERQELVTLIGLMARILWDDDNVPLQDSAGVNTGGANMMHQYAQGGRNFFALLLANDPEFVPRVKNIISETKKEIKSLFYENGASFGTPHYIQPAVDPLLFLLLQLKQAGKENLFTDPLIKKFALFYMGLHTPPSARFFNNRKIISLGDGTEESTPTIGLLAEGYKSIDAEFSNQLYTLYFNGPPRTSFNGPLPLAVNLENKFNTPFPYTSCSYDGYYSHVRYGSSTKLESAIWTINGNKYFDHRNDDAGETVIYSLGAPLSLSRNSFYYPRADAAHIRSMVIPAALFPEWDKKDQPITGRPYTWAKSSLKEFSSFKNSTSYSISSTVDSTVWIRKLWTILTPDSIPIIIFKDSLAPKEGIWSLPMVSSGTIRLNGENLLSPVCKKYFNGSSAELPEGTPAIPSNNTWNKFECIGQEWISHPTKGINWDIYSFSYNNTLGSTSCWSTNWTNSTEQSEFQRTNNRPYEESQQILRIRFNGKITNIIIPCLKGIKKPIVETIAGSTSCKIMGSNYTLFISEQGYSLSIPSTGLKRYGIFSGSDNLHLNDLQISNGPLEIERSGNILTIFSAGNKGKRICKIPGKWQLVSGSGISTAFQNAMTTFVFEQVSTLNSANGALPYKSFTFKSI